MYHDVPATEMILLRRMSGLTFRDWEETTGQTQSILEGLHIPLGLRALQDPPGGPRGHG